MVYGSSEIGIFFVGPVLALSAINVALIIRPSAAVSSVFVRFMGKRTPSSSVPELCRETYRIDLGLEREKASSPEQSGIRLEGVKCSSMEAPLKPKPLITYPNSQLVFLPAVVPGMTSTLSHNYVPCRGRSTGV